MPLFEGALGTALFAKGGAAAKGAGLLAGFLDVPAPALHASDHAETLAAPAVHLNTHVRGHGHDLGSFLNADASLAPSAHAASQHDLHTDFLFGSSSAAKGSAALAAVAPMRRRLAHGAMRLLPAAPAAAGALLAAPKLSMMAGAAAPGAVSSLQRIAKKIDPFGENAEGEETGWCKVVPRGLKIAAAADALSMLVLAGSYFDSCDYPLKSWLVGGMLLGYPISYWVNKVASDRPVFKYFRLKVRKLRGGGNAEDFKLEGLVIYDQFNLPIDRKEVFENKEGDVWSVSLDRGKPELITGYHFITDKKAHPKLDPKSWTLEGSEDGQDWRVLHVVEDRPPPSERGTAGEAFDELRHLEDSTGAFRGAFLLEVAANAVSFAWLVAGTAWVSAGTDTCVDTAPLLWCSSYLTVVIVWSFLGTVTIGLIVSAVAMVVLGARAPGSS